MKDCSGTIRKTFKNRAVARLLPLGSAVVELVAREVGVATGTLQRWREDVQSRLDCGGATLGSGHHGGDAWDWQLLLGAANTSSSKSCQVHAS
jgi:transposase-like protein